MVKGLHGTLTNTASVLILPVFLPAFSILKQAMSLIIQVSVRLYQRLYACKRYY